MVGRPGDMKPEGGHPTSPLEQAALPTFSVLRIALAKELVQDQKDPLAIGRLVEGIRENNFLIPTFSISPPTNSRQPILAWLHTTVGETIGLHSKKSLQSYSRSVVCRTQRYNL